MSVTGLRPAAGNHAGLGSPGDKPGPRQSRPAAENNVSWTNQIVVRRTTLVGIVIALAMPLTSLAEDNSRISLENPAAFCGWVINDFRTAQPRGRTAVDRHWLAPGDGCVLSLQVADAGSSAIDDESFGTIWVEIASTISVGEETHSEGTLYEGNVWEIGSTDSILPVVATVLKRTEIAIQVILRFEYHGYEVELESEFALAEPQKGDVLRQAS